MSEARAALLKKLSQLSTDIGFIEFDGENTGQKYKYASAAGVLRKINKRMGELGLTASSQSTVTHFEVEKFEENGKNKVRHHCVVHTELRVFDVDTGEFVMARGCGSGLDSGDKAVMKAETAAEKYAWRGMLTLGWGAEDPEADASTDAINKDEKTAAKPNLLAQIKAAGTTEELNALRAAISAMKDGPKKEKAKEAFRNHPAYVPPSKRNHPAYVPPSK
jgi:hypothetical protein